MASANARLSRLSWGVVRRTVPRAPTIRRVRGRWCFPGHAAGVHITGRQIALRALRGPYQAMMRVSIDGSAPVTITVSAHKNQASQGHDISLDAVEGQR
ncbi:hypothetical protein [Streptomyces sp. BE133]|uniref:hypothetical protein n=1 Tax=Streptomyces sp. BE133 TaxID=3002523 RepID=UPI002E76B9BC|nr:hypothetical protein [Streptomyces sp. BE133]MEE1808923.1 hypothetical protein [Streptomyces sp. BE133]